VGILSRLLDVFDRSRGNQVGKASRRKRERRDGTLTAADLKQAIRAMFKAWEIPAWEYADGIASDPSGFLDEDQAARWNQKVDRFAIALSSPETAGVLAVGTRRPLLERLIPRLVALVPPVSDGARQLVVDVGSGTGVLGIAVQKLTGAEVILLDPNPDAAVVSATFADAVDADVRMVTGQLSDLADVLDGRQPDLVMGQGLISYLADGHEHSPGLDWKSSLEERMRHPEPFGSEFGLLFTNAPRIVALADGRCPDGFASLVGNAVRSGYGLDVERSGGVPGGGVEFQHLAVFTPAAGQVALPDPAVLIRCEDPQERDGVNATSWWQAERSAEQDDLPPQTIWERYDGDRLRSHVILRADDEEFTIYVTHDDGTREFLEGPAFEQEDFVEQVVWMMEQTPGDWRQRRADLRPER
jgi:SAM-dependent methyltransferase